uniref:hypothetical protein n=1 Tax=Algoriphagus sp. TaxID=1872435 RepID=UPI00258814B0|nr:hypothetical protein [Algoriphagus sp.]
MPKALGDLDEKLLERLRQRLAKRVNVSFNTNKSYHRIADFLFEKTHVNVSQSTLRRVFQYDSPHSPTKSTLDLICQSLGYYNWEDFVEKESELNHFDLLQVISAIQIGGISSLDEVRKQVSKFIDSPSLFNLLEAIVDASISQRNISILGQLFELDGVFDYRQDSLKIYFFTHNLVIKLNKAGLMQKLIPHFGASEKAREFLIEWYVDEDHLDGYYYDLLQEYKKHKTGLESKLFYDCLMYQWAEFNKLSIRQWLEPIREFVETEPVHPIPKARRLGILMLEVESQKLPNSLKNEVEKYFDQINDDARIIAVLIIVRLLFSKRRDLLIQKVLEFLPYSNEVGKDIWTRINLNQLKIYRAYVCFLVGEFKKSHFILGDFDPLLVNNYIRESIIRDYEVVVELVKGDS